MRRGGKMPEIVMEGDHVLHTDEAGNILLDDNADRWIESRRSAHEELIRLFDAAAKDPSGETAAKFIETYATLGEPYTK